MKRRPALLSRARRAGAPRTARWASAGAAAGALLALVLAAPASWLAASLNSATGGHLLLADARGTVPGAAAR